MTPDEALALVTEYRRAIEEARVAKNAFRLARAALSSHYETLDAKTRKPRHGHEPNVRWISLHNEYVRCLHDLQAKGRSVRLAAWRLRGADTPLPTGRTKNNPPAERDVTKRVVGIKPAYDCPPQNHRAPVLPKWRWVVLTVS